MSDLTPEVVEELKRLMDRTTPIPLSSAKSMLPMDLKLYNLFRAAAPALIRAAEENAQLRAGNEMLSAANEAFSRDAIQLRARLAKAEVTLREIVSLTSAPAMRDADQDNIAVRVTVSMVRGYAKAALADYSAKETE